MRAGLGNRSNGNGPRTKYKEESIATLTQRQIEAAQEFADITIDELNMEHPETAVAGAARMAGTFLFRSFGFPLSDIQPGQIVLSDQANEQGPVLIEILAGTLSQIGVPLDEETLGSGGSGGNEPNQSFLETQRRLEPRFSAAKERHGLSQHEAAEASAVATALLIQHCSQVLDPTAAFDIAIYGFIEGTKTAPDPVTL